MLKTVIRKQILFMVLILSGTLIMAQKTPSSEVRKTVTLNPNSGYVTINELAYGYGLGGRDLPYAGYFYGITTMHGYQLNRYGLHVDNSLQGGIGTGILFYNGGNHIPLYVDLRYNWSHKQVSPFIFGNSGMLFDYEDFDQGSRIFINGGAGLRYRIDDSFILNLGTGLFIQMGNSIARDAFINVKLGVTYKPR